MLLSDHEIRDLCVNDLSGLGHKPMISPFSEGVNDHSIISYGLDHAGYCIRLDTMFRVFKNTRGEVVDPKRMKDAECVARMFDTYTTTPGAQIIIPGNGYILGQSYETFCIPRHLKGHCLGKSTYARVGLIVNVTPLEPEWEGKLTIEISNSSPAATAVYVMEGIAQIEFVRLSSPPQVSYKDKGGRYQNQKDVQVAIVK